MNKARSIYTVDFCRDNSSSSIEIELMKGNETISLFEGIIEYCSKVLSQKEIKTIIKILESKKEVMLEECDFPKVYDGMLNDLITAYEERYGLKDTNIGKHYRLSLYGLEEIIKQHYDLDQIHIDSVVGGVNYTSKRIDSKADNRTLFVDYTGWRKEDE
jgi:hypothetical protein